MIVRVHTTFAADFVQLVTEVLICAKLTDDPDVVTVTWEVRSEVVVVVTVVAVVSVTVLGEAVVSVTVLGERDPVKERAPKIKTAPTTIPTPSKAAPTVRLETILIRRAHRGS